MNIYQHLRQTASRRPGHPAIRMAVRAITYGELDEEVGRLSRGLATAGIRPQDVCVLMMPNSIEWVICFYALARLGAIVLPVNFLYKSGELEHIFSDSGARAFIGHRDYLDEPRRVFTRSSQIEILVAQGADLPAGFLPLHSLYQTEGSLPPYPARDDDTLAIIYTSGTTGRPKGAMLTHYNLASNARIVAEMRKTDPDDVVLGVLPFFHIYGLTSVMNASVYLGLTVRLWSHFDPEEVLSAIEEEKSTFLNAVPTMLNRLLAAAHPHPRRSSLRFVISGGSSLPVEILHRFEECFQTTIYEGYGLTECSPVCVENPFGGVTKPGSIGLPIAGFEARVVNDRDEEIPRGQIGELIIRGPGVMKGYLHQPEATAETLRGGWLHTGDLARMDEEGYIYIVDRKKEMIIRGGYNVYPREIEEVLYTHPAVLEAAVIGVPHADWGEEVAAFVYLREGTDTTAEALISYVKERVAPYKYPRQVHIAREPFPKSGAGKILKKELKRLV